MRADLFFSAWPYIALSLLVVGIIVRYLLERTRMAAVREEMSEAWSLFGGAGVWRASVLLLVSDTPPACFSRKRSWHGTVSRRGCTCLRASLSRLALRHSRVVRPSILRHLARTNRSAITELSDTVFLALVLSGIAFRAAHGGLHRWGSSWGTLVLTPYIASILLKLRPTAGLAMQTPFSGAAACVLHVRRARGPAAHSPGSVPRFCSALCFMR